VRELPPQHPPIIDVVSSETGKLPDHFLPYI